MLRLLKFVSNRDTMLINNNTYIITICYAHLQKAPRLFASIMHFSFATSLSRTSFLHTCVQFLSLLHSNESWGDFMSCFQVCRLLDSYLRIICSNLHNCFPALTNPDDGTYMLIVCHDTLMKTFHPSMAD